jgi:hypothetical protein
VIFQTMTGKEGWDTVFPSPQKVKEEAQMWLANVDSWNGRGWWPRPCKLFIQIDASAIEYRGFIRGEGLDPAEVAGTFTEAERALSSTEREIIGYTRTIQVAARRFPEKLNNVALLLQGDSQAAIAALRKFASSNTVIHNQLRHLFSICASKSFDIIPRWTPRSELTEADELSRRPDASDWGCSPELVSLILNHFHTGIDIDLFASEAHHVAPRFVSLFYTPGCTAVHALACDWTKLMADTKDTAWIFPPSKSVSAALNLIEKYRINALVIMPAQRATNEWIHIRHISGIVSQPFIIPKRKEFCQASLRVPVEAINPVLMGLAAFYIQWQKALR